MNEVDYGTTDIFGGFIETAFGRIDDLGNTFIGNFYGELGQKLNPAFMTFMAIYIVWMGWQMMFGEARITLGYFVQRIGGLALVISFAMHWATFEPIVAKPLMQAPNSIASAVCSTIGGSNCDGGPRGTAAALNNILMAGYNAALQVSAAGGWTGVGLMILAIVMMLIVGLFIVTAIGLLMLAKISIIMLLGLAPVFVACWLFPLTRPMMNGWITVLSGFAVLQIVVFGMLGLALFLVKDVVANITQKGTEVSMEEIVPFLVMITVCFALLKFSIPIALGIAGGARIDNQSGLGRNLRRVGNVGKNMVDRASRRLGASEAAATISPDAGKAQIVAAARDARR